MEPNRTEAQNKDLMIRSMGLISGLAQGLPTLIHRQVETSDLMKLLRQNVKDSRQEVRQASFALLGHLTNASFGLVENHLRIKLNFVFLHLVFQLLSSIFYRIFPSCFEPKSGPLLGVHIGLRRSRPSSWKDCRKVW